MPRKIRKFAAQYGHPRKIRQEIAPDIDRLNALIADQLATSNPLMDNVIANYLKSKGKLIRPIIVMLSARLFGPVTDKVLRAAASVELLHNASLIHDDVVDGSTIRRGRPTVNAMWDNHIAVLVGDFLFPHRCSRPSLRAIHVSSSLCAIWANC